MKMATQLKNEHCDIIYECLNFNLLTDGDLVVLLYVQCETFLCWDFL